MDCLDHFRPLKIGCHVFELKSPFRMGIPYLAEPAPAPVKSRQLGGLLPNEALISYLVAAEILRVRVPGIYSPRGILEEFLLF